MNGKGSSNSCGIYLPGQATLIFHFSYISASHVTTEETCTIFGLHQPSQ